MSRAGFDVSSFIAFSKLHEEKFNENQCIAKWKSFDKYEKDSRPIMEYLCKHGIFLKDTQTIGVKTDREAAEVVMSIYKHWVFCDGNSYVFDKKLECGVINRVLISVFWVIFQIICL